jgi:hypothetical protein
MRIVLATATKGRLAVLSSAVAGLIAAVRALHAATSFRAQRSLESPRTPSDGCPHIVVKINLGR